MNVTGVAVEFAWLYTVCDSWLISGAFCGGGGSGCCGGCGGGLATGCACICTCICGATGHVGDVGAESG